MGTSSGAPILLADDVRPREGQFSAHKAFQPSIKAAIPFSTVSSFFEALDRTPRDEDVFRTRQVSPDQFQALLRERDKRGRKFRCWYIGDVRLLIVTIPSLRHESTSRCFYSEVANQLTNMSLFRELTACGGQTHGGREPGGVTAGGEGDESWAPRSTRPGPDPWPTLVIEVGVTQTLTEMRAKAQLWFRISGFEVKIVLLVKLSSTPRSMMVEKWKALPRDPRPGPQTRAATASLEPRCVQTVAVLAPEGPQVANPQAFVVVSTDISLEFAELFLRQPGPNEGDIVIRTNSLRQIASDVFSR